MPALQNSGKNEEKGFLGTEVRDTWNTSSRVILLFPCFAVLFPGNFSALGRELSWWIIVVPHSWPQALPCPESHTMDGSVLGQSRKGKNHPALGGGCETNPVSKPWYLHFRVFQLTRPIRNSCPCHGFLQKFLTPNDGAVVIPRTSFLHRLKLWPHFASEFTWIIT